MARGVSRRSFSREWPTAAEYSRRTRVCVIDSVAARERRPLVDTRIVEGVSGRAPLKAARWSYDKQEGSHGKITIAL